MENDILGLVLVEDGREIREKETELKEKRRFGRKREFKTVKRDSTSIYSTFLWSFLFFFFLSLHLLLKPFTIVSSSEATVSMGTPTRSPSHGGFYCSKNSTSTNFQPSNFSPPVPN